MENNKWLRLFVIFIGSAIIGYWIGSFMQPDIIIDNKQRLVDSLTMVVNKTKTEYKILSDSICIERKSKKDNFLMIDQVKKTIRNEINWQTKGIYSIPDSAVQHMVDSIRSAGGFH